MGCLAKKEKKNKRKRKRKERYWWVMCIFFTLVSSGSINTSIFVYVACHLFLASVQKSYHCPSFLGFVFVVESDGSWVISFLLSLSVPFFFIGCFFLLCYFRNILCTIFFFNIFPHQEISFAFSFFFFFWLTVHWLYVFSI